MATANELTNLIDPPPRLTGDSRQDTIAVIQWLNAFYTNGILSGALLQAGNLPPAFASLLQQQFAELFESLYPILKAIADLVPVADQISYFTGPDTVDLANLTAFARTILDDANAGDVRTTIGAGTGDGNVVGPGGATPGNLVEFDGGSGNLLADAGKAVDDLVPYTGATGDVDLGAHSLAAESLRITGTAGAGFMDFPAQSANPAAPAAGTVRFHSATTQGFTRFEQDNEAPTNLVLGRDSVFIAKNTSGGTISAMAPVYVTGSTGNVPNIGKAKADATATLPSIGLVLDSIGNNNFGQVMRLGIMANVNTSAFTAGDLLFVSKDTAGVLVNTRPVSPNLAQAMAVVLVSGVGNGSLFVITAPFIGGQESGTTSAWVAASTIRPAQTTPNAYLSNDSSPGITGTLTTGSLVGKTLTFKDGLITGFA